MSNFLNWKKDAEKESIGEINHFRVNDIFPCSESYAKCFYLVWPFLLNDHYRKELESKCPWHLDRVGNISSFFSYKEEFIDIFKKEHDVIGKVDQNIFPPDAFLLFAKQLFPELLSARKEYFKNKKSPACGSLLTGQIDYLNEVEIELNFENGRVAKGTYFMNPELDRDFEVPFFKFQKRKALDIISELDASRDVQHRGDAVFYNESDAWFSYEFKKRSTKLMLENESIIESLSMEVMECKEESNRRNLCFDVLTDFGARINALFGSGPGAEKEPERPR